MVIGNTKRKITFADVLNNIELEGIAADAISWIHQGNIQSLALKKGLKKFFGL
jgi:hypothetical protein